MILKTLPRRLYWETNPGWILFLAGPGSQSPGPRQISQASSELDFMLHDCLNCFNERSLHKYFWLKCYPYWEEELPSVAVLKERIHTLDVFVMLFMWSCCVDVSYFSTTHSCWTDNQASLFVNEPPVPAVPAVHGLMSHNGGECFTILTHHNAQSEPSA